MTEPEVIFETKDFIAVNKPAGLLVHPARTRAGSRIDADKTQINAETAPVFTDWLLKRYPEVRTVGDDPELRPGIVHRLDRDTSGVMVIAKTQAAFEHLKSLFQQHEIIKTYLALVSGAPKETTGIIAKPIGLRNGSVKRSVHGGRMVKDAVTEYRVLRTRADKRGKEYVGRSVNIPTTSLLEVYPKTGRTHQIRVHLASIGHPIVGDTLYGKKTERKNKVRLMLHAASLEFTAPSGKRIRIDAAPPPEFESALGGL